MGFLDNVVNKSVPQGSSLAKPLMLAFGALLASGALTRKQAPTSAPATSPAADPQAGGLLGGLGGLLEKFQQSGQGDVLNHGSRAGQISRSRRVNLARRSVRHLSRPWPKRRVCPKGGDCATVENSASFC